MHLISARAWLYAYLKNIFPAVDKELTLWKTVATRIQSPVLRTQAENSIEQKAFHCYGGAVLALAGLPSARKQLITFIVAFQTISDYLDNLCDRAGVIDEAAFLTLHRSMHDAVDNRSDDMQDYYQLYAGHQESEYLSELVTSCKKAIRELPNYDLVRDPLKKLVEYYSRLQAYKHLDPSEREQKLKQYIEQEVPNPQGLYWWELAAATGSTLAMFTLVALATDPELSSEAVENCYQAYFPWICGLHILLDYLIDENEDKEGGDLNFVAYYQSENEKWEAIRRFTGQSLDCSIRLEPSSLHTLVVNGLLAMYLSDNKVKQRKLNSSALSVLRSSTRGTIGLYILCQFVRKVKKI